MGRICVHYILFLTYIILPDVRSEVTCNWTDSIPSEGKCFLYKAIPLSYADAKVSCLSLGGILAKVTTKSQMLEITKNLDDGDSVWIGANDIAVEGTWMWEDCSVATELNELWLTSKMQPSNQEGDNCADFYKESTTTSGLYDDKCSVKYPFLCMEKGENTNLDNEALTCTTTDPATTEPTTNDPLTTEPTTNDPLTTEPTTNAPATTQPTTNTLATTKPTTNAPATTQPTTTDPATAEPTTNAILTYPKPTSKCQNNGTEFIDFNVLLFVLLCVVIFLVI